MGSSDTSRLWIPVLGQQGRPAPCIFNGRIFMIDAPSEGESSQGESSALLLEKIPGRVRGLSGL